MGSFRFLRPRSGDDVTLKGIGRQSTVMDRSEILEQAADLPRDPGVYQFLEDGEVLYVGKAVDLRARVRSYADPRSERIRRMRRRADAVDLAVTDTETQALLLEANLIKRHQPRYNVRLKDDKSYPMVELTDHPAPRIEVTRDPSPDATVFGPFTNKGTVDTVVKAIREQYGLRGCSDYKYSNRDRPCLDFEMGLCSAPCTGEISLEEYRHDVERIERFFEGETGVLSDPVQRKMNGASEAHEYERAANLRDRLEAIESFHGGGASAVQAMGDERTVDVLGVAIEGEEATVARLRSERGKLLDRDRHHLHAPDPVDGTDRPADVLASFIVQYYAERTLPDALLLPTDHGDDEVAAWLDRNSVNVRVPGAGREATLVELALKNARRNVGVRDECAMLREALGIDRASRIEGFDVSHAQGKAAVGSNVTFVDGSADSSGYRRKRLFDTNDDYANMHDLITWRASRALDGRDDRPDPDLLVIDGGRGQLAAAERALEESGWDVPVIALAKREELVVTPTGEHDWPSDAPQLHLLQRVRDEAHRFAVQYHQTVRDDVETVLDDVPGIGPTTRAKLLGRFGSVENVRNASLDDLKSVPGVGDWTAQTLLDRL